jgi:hypothetical protein
MMVATRSGNDPRTRVAGGAHSSVEVVAMKSGSSFRRLARRLALPGLALLATLALAQISIARAAAVVEGPRSDVTTVTCSITPDGKTTCAISQGRAWVCARRVGTAIQRSFRRYDYLRSPEGCVLDSGYWRDHGPDGPAPYDEIWTRIGTDGALTPFFGSEQSYMEVLSQDGGADPLARLARSHVAVELNRLNGAALPEAVQAAHDEGTVILISRPSTLDPPTTARVREVTAILDRYLAGTTGPGICAPLPTPLGPADIGKPLVGLTSGDTGRIEAIDERKERGEGVVTIQPRGADDLFIVADEDFAVDDVRKAKFTEIVNDCVTVATGQETTTLPGGLPGEPVPISALLQQQARALQVMIALNTASEVAPVPGAGPAPPGPSGPTFPGLPGGGFGSFPSSVLQPTNQAGGSGTGTGGADLVVVPNLVGLTEGQARSTLASADLRVGQVTIASLLRSPLDGLMGAALAQTTEQEAVVQSQSPAAGELVPRFTQVDFVLTAAPTDAPEPSTLLLLLVALGALAVLIWWNQRRSARPQ